MRFLIQFFALLSLAVMGASLAKADDARPFYMEINEMQEGAYKVQWRIPPTVPAYNAPAVVLPDMCKVVGSASDSQITAVGQRLYKCVSPLAGETVQIIYPRGNPSTSSLAKYKGMKGEQYTALLSPSESEWKIPASESKSQVAMDYTILGIEHIWAGTDHLLFLICLLWISGGLRRVLITITGFTISHSFTLVLAALQVITVPVPPVEAAIALSVVFLAVEIARGKSNSLTWRYPIAVSSSFGLLHGLGFAAVLQEIGLPQTELVTGLLFFNVGVEIGQVLFAAVVVTLMIMVRKAFQKAGKEEILGGTAQGASAYLVGIIAAYWLVERCASFVV